MAENKNALAVSNDSMKFTIRPLKNQTQKTSFEVVTDAGAIHALLGWNPNPPVVGKNNLNINFSDALNGNRLNADVTYNLNIRTKMDKKL